MTRAAPIALAACLVSCGPPLADTSYQGEALLRFEGRLSGRLGSDRLVNPAVGVVWMGASGFLVGNVAGLTPVTDVRFPADFSAALFDPPPEGTRPWLNKDFFQMLSGVPVIRGLRVGVVVAVDDVDGDGRVTLTTEGNIIEGADRFFGAATTRVLGYVDSEYTSLTYKSVQLAPGFHFLAPCFNEAKVFATNTGVEVELFAPSRYLVTGARSSLSCPVVLFPQTRGPLQRALMDSADCSALCARLTTPTCKVSCSPEMCLRLVEESRCQSARAARLACLANNATVTCEGGQSADVAEGECPFFNELCVSNDPEKDRHDLAASVECSEFCLRAERQMGAGACSSNCALETCTQKTLRQTCVAAKRAQLACRSRYADNSECIDFFSQYGGLCVATAQFEHLCPDLY